MNESADKMAEQAAAFQKIWTGSMSKLMQTAFSFGQGTAPPEVMREIRSGIFQALAKSWEEFLRSPQFLEGTKQWMDQAIAFRKVSNDFMAHVRNEWQSTSREDVDTIMLTIRHFEQRLLDRIEGLSEQVGELRERLAKGPNARPGPNGPRTKRPSPANSKKAPHANRKVKTV